MRLPPLAVATQCHYSHLAGTTVVGGVNDKVAACTQTVKDQEEIKLGGISIKCIETPLWAPCACLLCSHASRGRP